MSGRLVSVINDHLQALYISNHWAKSFKRLQNRYISSLCLPYKSKGKIAPGLTTWMRMGNEVEVSATHS